MIPIVIAMLSSPIPWRQWRVWSNCQAVLVAEHRDAGPETLRAVATPVNSRSGSPQTSDALGVIAHSAGRQSPPRAAATASLRWCIYYGRERGASPSDG